MPILSIQSHVAYGHVGNDAAVFPLQRLGHEVWAVHTVQFAAHTGYGPPKGQVFEASHIREVIEGIAAREDFATCEAVLSGYMGSAAIGEAILDAVMRVKIANHAAPQADIVTPNLFELEALTGRTCSTLDDTKSALRALHAKGPRVILLTSAVIDETPRDAVDMIASDGKSLWRIRSPRLGFSPNGAGDLTAALFLAHYLKERSVPNALALAASSVHAILEATFDKGGGELALIAAQNALVQPPLLLSLEPL